MVVVVVVVVLPDEEEVVVQVAVVVVPVPVPVSHTPLLTSATHSWASLFEGRDSGEDCVVVFVGLVWWCGRSSGAGEVSQNTGRRAAVSAVAAGERMAVQIGLGL